MNILKKTINLFLLCCGCCLFTACKTTSDCPPGDIICMELERQKELGKWAADLRDLSEIGVIVALEEDPGSKVIIEKATAALDVLATDKLLTIDKIVTALRNAGVSELNSKKGKIYITAGKIVFRRVVDDYSVLVPEEALLFLNALNDGMKAGLGL